jgi:hypothetical protein
MHVNARHLRSAPALLAAVVLLAPALAQAQAGCVRHLAYVDLITGGVVDTTGVNPNNPGALEVLRLTPAGTLADSITTDQCTRPNWFTAVVRVDLPPQCNRAVVWLDYDGVPADWTLNIGDSDTNNGFGGDAGTSGGRNAEVEVLHQQLRVWSAADNPADVDPLVTQQLGLQEGALRFTVQDQKITWGQPYNSMETPDLERLFFLPANPGASEDRVVYVGLNRVVAPLGGPASRTGCGVSKAMVMFE